MDPDVSIIDQEDFSGGGRLVIVSNRLPIMIRGNSEEGRQVLPGTGGLVTALAPILRDRGGKWIGWPGSAGVASDDLNDLLRQGGEKAGYELIPVNLTRPEVDGYYYGFSNEILWPLFHDLQTRCNMDADYWWAYQKVNRRFAAKIVEQTNTLDTIWVHDYHLILVGNLLRALGVERKVNFFLHTPFPGPDIFLKLPWREKLIRALLDYDLIGFQTQRDRQNFIRCVRALAPDVTIRGRGRVLTVPWAGRGGKVGVFPISIDYNHFAVKASSGEVSDAAWFFHEDLPERQIVLSIDRLDYTKGIPNRLEAIRSALLRHPEMTGKVTFVQVVVPSRRDIPEYADLKSEIEALVGEINGEFTTSGWVPIHYLFRPLSFEELLGYYRASEIMLVTPLKDGMNLVAKEYCASNSDETGALILSEFAGAAAQLKRGALLVNPYDTNGVADAIYRAYTMDVRERKSRMKNLRSSIRRHDVFWWVDSFLGAAGGKNLAAFPAQPSLPHDEPIEQETPSLPG